MAQPHAPPTLETCDREPIHVPGSIQPHGVLFACRPGTLEVTQVSDNVASFFGVAAEGMLGRSLGALFDGASAERLAELSQRSNLRDVNPFRLTAKSGAAFDAAAHRSGEWFVLEAEPADPAAAEATTIAGFDPRLRSSVMRLQRAVDVRTLMASAAEELQRLTGFDRVMVYRFDSAWNGEVVAESKRDDLAPLLGWHYPASDIPAQARRLYTVNLLRFIVDVAAAPSPLVPLQAPDGQALDMSHGILRSVSPIHLEYLRNMGVKASMSVSLIVDGALAGLIACHHYSGPFLVPIKVRDTAEYLAQAFAWHLRVLELASRAERARDAQEHEAEVVRSMATAGELLDGLDTPALLSLTDAGGAAVVLEEGIRRIGNAPPIDEIQAILRWLRAGGHDVYSTEELGRELSVARSLDGVAAGLLAVAIARDIGEYILWFRPSVTQTIDWGGNPDKAIVAEPGGAPRLTPRGSFELWREVVRGRSLPWMPWELEAASSLRRVLLGGVRRRAVQLRSINQRLIEADRAKDNFIATVSHELRTPLNAISGWTALLQRGGLDDERRRDALEIIARNAQTQTQLVEDLLDVSRMTTGKVVLDVATVDVAEIARDVIQAAAVAVAAKEIDLRSAIQEPRHHVRGDALRLRQIVTNLLSNAVKFTPKRGRIEVAVRRVESDVEVAVTDTGRGIGPEFLPHVFEAFRQEQGSADRSTHGLGLGLAIVKKLVELHGGRVTVESPGAGMGAVFRVRLPVSPFMPDEGGASAPKSTGESSILDGVVALVVDDDPDSRELIGQILQRSRATVHLVSDAAAALDAVAAGTFDVLISDIGMPDMDGLRLMREIRQRHPDKVRAFPSVALTAYARASDRIAALQAGFQAHVPKPVDPDELVTTIASLLGRSRTIPPAAR